MFLYRVPPGVMFFAEFAEVLRLMITTGLVQHMDKEKRTSG